MRLHYLVISLVITLFWTSSTLAKDLMDPVIVTANKIKTKDTKATYASEVYNRKDIEQSGTKSLYEFLSQSTSIVTMPSAGNTFSQKLDMRGFGLTDGYKHVVVTINGRRLNNIDSVPQRLSTISINNIERIEITKGSGSVVHGDGATGGSIQIYTRDTSETTLEGSVGNYGISTGSFTSGYSDEKFILSLSGDTYHQDGFSDKDLNGHRDSGTSNNYSTKLKYFPTEASEVFIEKDYSEVNIRYPNALTLETFKQNPGSSYKTTQGVKKYNLEVSDTNNLTLGGTLELSNNLEANFTYTHQDKVIVLDTRKTYHNNAIDSSIKYKNGPLNFITGIQKWDGARLADTWDVKSSATARKRNFGIFSQGSYDIGSTVFSLGLRGERVEYSFQTDEKTYHLLAYDLGINRTLSDHLSIFSNLNYAFLAPDVDRLFDGIGKFRGYLNPTKATTLNFGVNHVTSKNKIKLTLYGMTLKDELYYSSSVYSGGGTFSNTNLDSSYKYGLELNDKYYFNNKLSANINYSYTKAMIDYEPAAGDELPQVSEHTVSLGVNYNPTSKSRIAVGHVYRSEMLAEEDFPNNFTQKNKAYNSTNLSYTYSYKTDSGKGLFNWWQSGPRQADISLKVDNLFEESNGSWLNDDTIYPYQFTRNWRIGTKLLF
jgi:iron complex outermembrane receptor protein